MDKTIPADWLAIKPKSVITISDAQGIQDSMRRGLGVRGIDYTVRTVSYCEHLEKLSTHVIFTLEDEEQPAFLVAKLVDELVDLFLYFERPDLPGGQRPDLLERGMYWLFQAPENPEAFEPSDLRYTKTIVQTIPDAPSGAPQELVYELKPQGELQCHYKESSVRTGLSPTLLATLAEYRCAQPAENPELLVLEVGEERSRKSFVRLFVGCALRASEVDVLSV